MKILIVYELENREYDNAQLLAAELERRGHNVIIENKATCLRFKRDIDILIIPNCYTTENFELYTYMTNARNIPVYNLQYEQVLSQAGEKRGYHNPKGKARQAIHLCWGKASYNRLMASGINPKQLRITGALHLDFLRDEFSDYYMTRSEISEKSGIPMDKKWLLYISSFTKAGDDAQPSSEIGINDKNAWSFIRLSQESRRETFKWFETLMNEDSDAIILYRLHPAEREDQFIHEFQELFQGRFILIDTYSVKQWIVVADYIFTWFSTSIIESFFAKKMCYILRPLSIPEEIDSVIFRNAIVIDKEKDFMQIIRKEKPVFSIDDFPIDTELIKHYYDFSADKPAYIRIADEIESCVSIKYRDYYRENEINFIRSRIRFLITKPFGIKSILERSYMFLYRVFRLKLSHVSPIKANYLCIMEQRSDRFPENKLHKDNNLKELRNIANATSEL